MESSVLNAGSRITLYTAQTPGAYDILVKTGTLSGDRKHADKDFIKAYDWLKNKMIERGYTPPVSDIKDIYPIWTWYDFGGKIPTCKSRELGIPNNPYVLLTLEVDSSRVLLSDFEFWHYILNEWYLTKNDSEIAWPEIEDDTFQKNREASWNRIFDIYDEELLEYHGMLNSRRFIQGVLWNIAIEDVVSAKPFIAK